MPDTGVIALMIPILALMIPIVAILTAHQRKMAEFYARNQQPVQNPDITALRHEIHELKQLVHQQAIAIDNLTSGRANLTPPAPPLQDRLGG